MNLREQTQKEVIETLLKFDSEKANIISMRY
jgi:hypothetical protein